MDYVTLTIILRVEDDAIVPTVVWIDLDLHFSIGIDTDVEDLPIPGEPGVSPPPVVANADRGDTVDDAQWSSTALSLHQRTSVME